MSISYADGSSDQPQTRCRNPHKPDDDVLVLDNSFGACFKVSWGCFEGIGVAVLFLLVYFSDFISGEFMWRIWSVFCVSLRLGQMRRCLMYGCSSV